MVFEYFHGTSTIFLDSIRQHGLGAFNPSQANLCVLRVLHDYAERHLINCQEYQNVRITTQAMVNQTSIQFIDLNGYKNVLHFRHDGIYMALSREKAAMYAVRNTYGSEILGRCIILFELLTANGVNATLPEEAIGQFDFRAFVGVKRKPIMIQAIGIEDVKLEKEDGKTAKEALDFLRRELPNFNARERFEFIQYCNFKLLSPVPPKKLNYYEIEFEGEPGKPNFEFTLNRI